VTDVVLNFKKCQVRLNRSEPLIFTFKWSGEGELTAKEVFAEQDIEVYTPDQVILTSTGEDTEVEMEIKVSRGRGFVTAEEFELEHAPIGTIYLDASFSPVTRVNFQVEDARVGQTTDYDRLILDVWTNGSITPEDAVEEAARLLIDHLRIFVQQDDEAEGGGQARDEDPELTRKLSRPIEELELSVRAANCLKAANIETIGDLVVLEEGDLLQFHNFGRKSLEEIKDVLETYDLSLGMDVAPPPAAVAAAAPAPAEETEEAGEPSGEEE
jgi:DNA-directed RNA polymerase subunit alpha